MQHQVLDHGYVRLVESWGCGDKGVPEAGIIEAARQSTQGNFRNWEAYQLCEACGEWWVGANQDWLRQQPCPSARFHDVKEYPRGDEGLLRFLFSGKPQHATPFEFCGMVVEVQAPIFVFREWHRHRTQSYNEMSARYAPLPANDYAPTPERCLLVSGKNRQSGAARGAREVTHESALEWLEELSGAYEHCEQVYQSGLRRGIPKEVARVVVPVGRYSRMRASANLRNWLAFMTLRADPAAQWEIRQYAEVLGTILAEQFPRTWSLFAEARGAQERA